MIIVYIHLDLLLESLDTLIQTIAVDSFFSYKSIIQLFGGMKETVAGIVKLIKLPAIRTLNTFPKRPVAQDCQRSPLMRTVHVIFVAVAFEYVLVRATALYMIEDGNVIYQFIFFRFDDVEELFFS